MLLDPECEAAFLLRDFGEPPGAQALVRHHLGPGSIVRLRGLRGAPAQLATVHGRPIIAVHGRLSREELRFNLSHELAEWHLRRLDYREDDAEQVADAIAACLVAPRDSFWRALREYGEDRYDQLALDFMATQTCVALRLGEVLGTPLIVVAPHSLRVRGEPFGWPEDEAALRRLVRRTPRGLTKAALTDAKRRYVIKAG